MCCGPSGFLSRVGLAREPEMPRPKSCWGGLPSALLALRMRACARLLRAGAGGLLRGCVLRGGALGCCGWGSGVSAAWARLPVVLAVLLAGALSSQRGWEGPPVPLATWQGGRSLVMAGGGALWRCSPGMAPLSGC